MKWFQTGLSYRSCRGDTGQARRRSHLASSTNWGNQPENKKSSSDSLEAVVHQRSILRIEIYWYSLETSGQIRTEWSGTPPRSLEWFEGSERPQPWNETEKIWARSSINQATGILNLCNINSHNAPPLLQQMKQLAQNESYHYVEWDDVSAGLIKGADRISVWRRCCWHWTGAKQFLAGSCSKWSQSKAVNSFLRIAVPQFMILPWSSQKSINLQTKSYFRPAH